MPIGYTNPITGQGLTGAKTPAETMATLRPDTVLGDHSNPTPPPGPQGPQGGNQGAFPDVQGGQYASPGAAGVTKYGLFSNARGGQPPGPGLIPPGGRRPTLPPGFGRGQPPPQMPRGAPGAGLRPPGKFQPPPQMQGLPPTQVRGAAIPRIQPPAVGPQANSSYGAGAGQQMTGFINGGPQQMQPSAPKGDPRALLAGLAARRPGAPGQQMTGQMGGSEGGGQGALGQPPRPVNNDPRLLLNSLRGGMGGRQTMGGGNPQQPQQMQANQQPPPNQQNAGLQQKFDQQQQQAQASAADRSNTFNANDYLKDDGQGNYTWDVAGEAEDLGGEAGDLVGDVAGAAGGAAGQALGEGFSSFVDAWNAANPGSNMSYEDFLNMPGFEQSSLMGDVGQNWTSAMDPAAWEQMAQNRLAAANEANMGALNRGERRLADRAGRTGFANTGGVTSQMYNDYAGRGVQAERDIFNDTLMNQMNALQGASGFALGQNAQDQARWMAEYGGALHGADQDFGANREDNPSGAAVLGDLLSAAGGAAGGAAGAAGQGAGGIMSLLSIPGVMSMLAGL